MKAIVTGVAGFIGCHVAKRLLDNGWNVVGIDNLSRHGNSLNLNWLNENKGDWQFAYCDIRSQSDVTNIFRQHSDTQLVIHEAGQVAVTTSVANPRLDFEANALGTFNILEAIRTHCPDAFLIFPSTNKVYGDLLSAEVIECNGRYTYKMLPLGIDESQNLDFHSPYGCAKGAADQYVRDYNRIFGLRTVVCRQSCIYGTRQFGIEDQGWIAWFLIAGLNRLPVTLFGDGKQVRDVLWIDDLVDLYLLLYENADSVAGNVYNVGGGNQNTLSLNELISAMPNLIGNALHVTRSDWRPGDQKVYVSNITAVKHDLNWKPRIDTEQGLRLLAEWLKENKEDIRRILHTRA